MRDYLTKKELMKLRWKRVERLQNLRFKAVVRGLLPHTKAYSDLFSNQGINYKKIRCVEDWHKFGLPLFKKKYYLNNPSQFVVAPDVKQAFAAYKKFVSTLHKAESLSLMLRAVFMPKKTKDILKDFYTPKMPFFSSGTESGVPTPVFITTHQKKLMEKLIAQSVELIQSNNDFSKESATGMNLFPYGPHLAWHATNLALDIACDLNLNTAAGGAISTEALTKMAEKFKPKVFAGMHNYLKDRFFPMVALQKIELPIRSLVINGAVKMASADREQLAKVCQKAGIVQPIILDLYGASELKEDLLPECVPNSGFHHISPLSTIIRTVKAETTANEDLITKWEFTPPEEGGYAAIWSIDGAGTLFEGYLIGDQYEKISRDKCEHCGLKVERIYNVNRIKEITAQETLTGIVEEKVKGAKINLTAIRDGLLLLDFVKEVQLVVEKGGKQLLVRFASPLPPAKAIIAMRKSLNTLEITPKIELVAMEKLVSPNKKFEPFVVK